MPKNLVFTPIPFNLTDIPLATIVPNILTPTEDTLSVITPSPEEIRIRDQGKFNGALESDIATSFFGQITKLFGFSRHNSENHSMTVHSNEGKEYELKSPKTIFRKLCDKEEVLDFLRDGVKNEEPSWFVTSLRTFTDAKVEIGGGSGKSWSIEGAVPAGQLAGSIGGIPTGKALDVSGGARRTNTLIGDESFEVKGERVFAIEFRKIIVKKREGNASAKLKEGTAVWKTSLDVRASTEEEEFTAEIEDEGETLIAFEDEELEDVHRIVGGDSDQYIVPVVVETEDA